MQDQLDVRRDGEVRKYVEAVERLGRVLPTEGSLGKVRPTEADAEQI